MKRPGQGTSRRSPAPSAPSLPTDPSLLAFASAKAWSQWLARHHTDPTGIWLKFAKKGSGLPSVTYLEALEIALCYGWIDGQLKSIDATFYKQRFCPRRPRSKWSQLNRAKAERLIAAGKMKPAGLAQVHAAQADGRWRDAYASPRTATVPPDLEEALERAGLRPAFDALPSGERYSILYRLQDAKRPETRARRLAACLDRLAQPPDASSSKRRLMP